MQTPSKAINLYVKSLILAQRCEKARLTRAKFVQDFFGWEIGGLKPAADRGVFERLVDEPFLAELSRSSDSVILG